VKTYAGFRRAWRLARDGDRHEAIDEFVEMRLARYADDRDFPSREGTSRLSPLIASGEITVADCTAAALAAPPSKGREKWLDELARLVRARQELPARRTPAGAPLGLTGERFER
jgi:deoxyribodipyrimidine photolyase